MNIPTVSQYFPQTKKKEDFLFIKLFFIELRSARDSRQRDVWDHHNLFTHEQVISRYFRQ